MNPPFQINLIRHTVDSTQSRIVKHLLIISYLLICALLLVLTCHVTTLRLIEAAERVREKTAMEITFDLNHSNQDDRETYAAFLENALKQETQKLRELEDLIAGKTDFAGILLGLALPLPYNFHLMSCSFDGAKKTIEIALVVPLEGSDTRRLSPAQMIDIWTQDPVLMGKILDIKSVLSERLSVSGKQAFVYRFQCTLPKAASS